jgi:hypothetical protein
MSAHYKKCRCTLRSIGTLLKVSVHNWEFWHTSRNVQVLLKYWCTVKYPRPIQWTYIRHKITSVQGWASSYCLAWQKSLNDCSFFAPGGISPREGVDPSLCRCWVPATAFRPAYMEKRSHTGSTWSHYPNVRVLYDFPRTMQNFRVLLKSLNSGILYLCNQASHQKTGKANKKFQFFHFQLQIRDPYGDLSNA